MMSHCDFVYGPPDSFSPMNSSKNSNSSEETYQSNVTRHDWETAGNVNADLERVILEQNPKVFKCKTCAYAFSTKEDLWNHSRIHIKPEKMRTCPICNFVTEFKHHLEYHVRNHFGSKPFKCEKCPYSCVSNSMLNSHMKSHSYVYQYNCADCPYATKYLYTLKIHLRKLQHKPGMVFHPDGTINPEPVVDIYGTKRGPKRHPKKTQGDNISLADAQYQTDHVTRLLYSQMMSSKMVPAVQISALSPMTTHVNLGAIDNTLGINGINDLPYHMTHFIKAMAGNIFSSGPPSINSGFYHGSITAEEAVNGNATSSVQVPSESPINLKISEENYIQDNDKGVIGVPDIRRNQVSKYQDYYVHEEIVPLDLSKSGKTRHGSGNR
ncbi:DNA-binding protein Ikaros-like [Belonocnema kinseyi]|uniref:DNA-binding protein Ikaros-like n=1 Tax=Belonocnema kinseyi TaxID=2817044 RepID=UPI00143D5C1C|nr:DNA-binding protein Ikaros-like [Belonocnema kinseyi]